MKLNAPKFVTWVIAVVLLVVGLLSFLAVIPLGNAFWLAFAGGALCCLACALAGL